ncbi:RNA helicase [Saxophila tyrrhenica]|uniref:RNA helicase n=1 Tax=Saxophila tyrrhenica TaxID=1690608 RepID=A0AAV9PLV0_9PEZI|nr:RNA helicase [Saxophila tyrrhenica]
MLRLSSSLCPFCEARALARTFYPSWQPSRSAATLQKRKPSRMILSSTVKRGPPPVADGGRATSKPKSRNSPFGGMNVTEVPRTLQAPSRSQASRTERRRTSRTQPATSSSRRKDDRKSKDPMHALKMQRSLANVSYEKRGRIKNAIMERDSFGEFELLPVVKESIPTQALGRVTDVHPTPVQRLAIPALLGMEENKPRRRRLGRTDQEKQMEQFLLAAETGSGKTLAYLLPVIDALKRAELAGSGPQDRKARLAMTSMPTRAGKLFDIAPPSSTEPDEDTARPRAIILVPTSELVEQVGALVKSLSHTVKFRAALLSSAYTGKMIRSRLFTTSGIDVVVTTPHLLHSITESDPNVLSRVTHLVIDEADSLLDRSFAPTTSGIIDRASPSLNQLILCSATIPRSLDKYLERRFPAIKRLVTPNLHAIPRRVQLSVVDIDKVPFQGNRNLACAQVIWDIGKEGAGAPEDGGEGEPQAREKKIVVFVNEREKSVELAQYLRSKGVNALALSRDSNERRSDNVLASFTNMPQLPAPASAIAAPASASGAGSGTYTPNAPFLSSINPPTPPQQPAKPLSPGPRPPLPGTQVLVTTDLSSRGIDTLPVKHVILFHPPLGQSREAREERKGGGVGGEGG